MGSFASHAVSIPNAQSTIIINDSDHITNPNNKNYVCIKNPLSLNLNSTSWVDDELCIYYECMKPCFFKLYKYIDDNDSSRFELIDEQTVSITTESIFKYKTDCNTKKIKIEITLADEKNWYQQYDCIFSKQTGKLSCFNGFAKIDGEIMNFDPIYTTKSFDGISQTCIICQTERATIIILPCRHQCLCDICVKTCEQRITTCPFCRCSKLLYYKNLI